MWKLKIAEGDMDAPWLKTTNCHIGRQHWEFDREAGTPEERARVETIRLQFKERSFRFKQSSHDLLMRMQVLYIYIYILYLLIHTCTDDFIDGKLIIVAERGEPIYMRWSDDSCSRKSESENKRWSNHKYASTGG